jgi:hypothetical protein
MNNKSSHLAIFRHLATSRHLAIFRHPREGGDPCLLKYGYRYKKVDSRLRGNDIWIGELR